MQRLSTKQSVLVLLAGLAGLSGCGGVDDGGERSAPDAEFRPPPVDFSAEFANLSRSEGIDDDDWFALAARAREQGDTEIAARALDNVTADSSNPRVALERARIAVTADDRDAAVSILQTLAETGFTGVRQISEDATLQGLAGHAEYDALVDSMSERAYPCLYDDAFRAFDFWLGEWDVHVASGQYAGRNSIRSEESGCVITEHWVSASGSTGSSINYLDKRSGEWVQVWNAEGGSQIDIRGGMTDEGMRLSGQIHYVGSGTTADFRGLWTPLEDGRVRQFFEQSNDGGATWQPWFEGFYSRIDAAGAGH